jgi:restriction endonuclease S subunit
MVPNGWEVKTLKDITLKIQDGNYGAKYPKADELVDKGIPFLTSKALGGSGKTNPKKYDFITIEKHIELKKAHITTNDILFTNRGANVGVIGIAGEDLSDANIGPQLTLIRSNEKLVSYNYLYFFMKSSFFQRQVQGQDSGSAMNFFGIKSTEQFKIKIPPLPEQQKIAKILSTWDKAISATERLIENSTQQKKALMQQLLTGKKRFGYKDITYNFQKTRYGDIPVDWEYPVIKDISIQLSKKNTDGKDYPVVSCSKHYGFVDSLDYFKKKVYSDDTSGYRIIPRNTFGFPSNHIEEGSIGLQTVHDIAIASPIYVVFKTNPNLINNIYLYALLKTEHYRQIFCAATNASVDRRGSLRWKEFSAIRIPLPPVEEQQKIATVLSNADREIELLKQQLADLQQEKKALMQVLLTGKRRVLVEE